MRKEFEAMRKQLIEKLPNECCNCGSRENIQFHHIVPLVHGGTNKLTNITPVCSECHSMIHNDVGGLKSVHKKGPRGLQTNSSIKKIPILIKSMIDEKGFATRTELAEELGYTNEHTLTANWIRHRGFLQDELNRLGICQMKDPNDKRFTIFIKHNQAS